MCDSKQPAIQPWFHVGNAGYLPSLSHELWSHERIDNSAHCAVNLLTEKIGGRRPPVPEPPAQSAGVVARQGSPNSAQVAAFTRTGSVSNFGCGRESG